MQEFANICPICCAEWPDPGVCSDGHPAEMTEEVEIVCGEVIVTTEVTSVVTSNNSVSAFIHEGESLMVHFTDAGRVFVSPGTSTDD